MVRVGLVVTVTAACVTMSFGTGCCYSKIGYAGRAAGKPNITDVGVECASVNHLTDMRSLRLLLFVEFVRDSTLGRLEMA